MGRNSPGPEGPGDPRTYFAAERTLLAWIRTGLAMMGFGFVVARFGLFLRELAAVRDVPQQPRLTASMWIGTGLVILGVGVNLLAAYKHWQTVRHLARGETVEMRALSSATIVAVLLGIVGLLIVINLLIGLSQPT